MSEYTEGGSQDDTISEGSGSATEREAEIFDKKVLVKDEVGYEPTTSGGTAYESHKTTTKTSTMLRR